MSSAAPHAGAAGPVVRSGSLAAASPAAPFPVEDPTGPRRAERRRRAPGSIRRLAGPLLLVVVWTVLTVFSVVDRQALVRPDQVVSAGAELWRSGELQENLLASLARVAWGLALGTALGLVLAVVAGLFRLGEDIVDSSMNVLRAVPVIALFPLVIVWMGIGEPAKISLIVVASTFPVYMNTFSAIRGVDARLVEAGRTFGLGRIGLIRRVIVPGALPGFFVGLRWAIGSAWLLLIFSEQINADSGIGYLMNQAQNWNRTDVIFLGIVIYGALGLLSDGLVRLLERYVLSWRKGFSGT